MTHNTNPAINEYKQALTLKPDYVEAYLGLGWSYAAIGDLDQAIATYTTGLQVSVDFPPGYAEMLNIQLGSAYLKQGRDEKALEAFKQAVAINADSVEAHYRLGLAYLKTGDRQAAMSEYVILKDLSEQRAEELRQSIEKNQ